MVGNQVRPLDPGPRTPPDPGDPTDGDPVSILKSPRRGFAGLEGQFLLPLYSLGVSSSGWKSNPQTRRILVDVEKHLVRVS